MSRLARFAWTVLAYTIGVILWGAYVRATGSGAGCGSHWPLCNGEVVPRAPDVAMLIEFSHRVMSGVALLAVAGLFLWVRRTCAPGHPARRGAALSALFLLTEAAVGAGLVVFGLVADNESAARAMFMAVHLLNTFLLLACLALTAWWLSGGRTLDLRANGRTTVGVAGGCAALLLIGSSGAIAALGDTLYPAETLAAALGADLSATSHILIRLRILHPVLAIAGALGLAAYATALARHPDAMSRSLARALILLLVTQAVLGFGNVMLLAPVWLQLVHLLVADAIWIAFVLLGACALAYPREVQAPTDVAVHPSSDHSAPRVASPL